MLAVSILALAACRSQPQDAAAGTTGAPPYEPTATIKDLMQSIVDTSADDVWLSVSTVQTKDGTIETVPQTDEDWEKVRFGALALAESANLLMMPGRRVARPGEKSETPGVELEPEEMQVLIEKDWPGWLERAGALHDAAMEVLAAVEARSPEKVFEIGERIEHACESCHSTYWYPNEEVPGPPVIEYGTQQ